MRTFKLYFNKTIITLCVLFFFVLWYQIISKIICNSFCDPEVETNVTTLSQEEIIDQRLREYELKRAERKLERKRKREKARNDRAVNDTVDPSTGR